MLYKVGNKALLSEPSISKDNIGGWAYGRYTKSTVSPQYELCDDIYPSQMGFRGGAVRKRAREPI